MTYADMHYAIGDATLPQGNGPRVIAHVCNNRGGFGSGFAAAVAKRYPAARNEYKQQIHSLHLGEAQFVAVGTGLWMANLIAQDGYATAWHKCALRYDDLALCLELLARFCRERSARVVCPRIGTGLAGGSWDKVSALLVEKVVSAGVNVTVYDLVKK
jgi:O-acetyl-ADP-ribose deacetylase (regulator of RNase III)